MAYFNSMSEEPSYPPPSYAGASIRHHAEGIELPNYCAGPLYENYHAVDSKGSPYFSPTSDGNDQLDLEQQPLDQYDSPVEDEIANPPKRRNCLRFLKPSEARRALNPPSSVERNRDGGNSKSLSDVFWKWISAAVVTVLYLIYCSLVLGIPAVMIWAGVRAYQEERSKG